MSELGDGFGCVERTAVATLNELGPYLIAVNDPPWSSIASQVPEPTTVVMAHQMQLAKLDRDVEATADDGAEVIVGFGGGTALDTAKYLAWKRGLPLVQIPTITPVDAGFTDAIGVRADGHVRYAGAIESRRRGVPLRRHARRLVGRRPYRPVDGRAGVPSLPARGPRKPTRRRLPHSPPS